MLLAPMLNKNPYDRLALVEFWSVCRLMHSLCLHSTQQNIWFGCYKYKVQQQNYEIILKQHIQLFNSCLTTNSKCHLAVVCEF